MRPMVLIVAAVVALAAAAFYLMRSQNAADGGNTPSTAWLQEYAQGNLSRLVPLKTANLAPAQPFQTPDGDQIQLADFKGRAVVVNFWATWCAPCRHEMPSLNRLAAAFAGEPVAVLAISLDRGGAAVAQNFLNEVGADRLVAYVDPKGALARELAVFGLPVTLIIDPQGYVLARHDGPAEWDRVDAMALVRQLISSPDAPPTPPGS